MDVFKVHQRLIRDYKEYTSGSVVIDDARIDAQVAKSLADGDQWPDPYLSLNPSFAPGGSVEDLARPGTAAPGVRGHLPYGQGRAGRHRPPDPFPPAPAGGDRGGRLQESYVLTTGTGSGKSLGYIVPIVDRVLREKEDGAAPGIKAIIVYPMNALANSQEGSWRSSSPPGTRRGVSRSPMPATPVRRGRKRRRSSARPSRTSCSPTT
ncbi:DEAD/DEAH box helicase [Streptomyces sp. M19]